MTPRGHRGEMEAIGLVEVETKTLSVEEMAVVTEKGAEYLIPPQEELLLIPSPAPAP